MNVDVDIKRKDLVALSFYLLPRARANWVMLFVLVTAIFVFLVVANKPANLYSIVVAIFSAVVGGVAGLLVGFSINLLTLLLTAGKKSGVLGMHRYTLTEAGLHELTDANESLQRWSGISKVTKVPTYILFQINSYLFHIVPRRAFDDEKHFVAFYEKAKALRSAA